MKKTVNIIVGALVALLGISAVIYKHIDKMQYIKSYEVLQLQEIGRNKYVSAHSDMPTWQTYSTGKGFAYLQTEYDVSLPEIDFENEMIIVSHNAELESMDYNLRESTYKDRGHYIGFAHFGKSAPDTVIFYKAQNVPLFDTDVGGFPPDYDGKYR